jgi:hypothetical protein
MISLQASRSYRLPILVVLAFGIFSPSMALSQPESTPAAAATTTSAQVYTKDDVISLSRFAAVSIKAIPFNIPLGEQLSRREIARQSIDVTGTATNGLI